MQRKIGNAMGKVVDLARQINLQVGRDDAQKLLDSRNQELIINEQEQDIEVLKSLDSVQLENRMTVGNLTDGLSLIEKGEKVEITDFDQSISGFQECDEDVGTWMACDAEGNEFQMLNDDEIMTSVQEESDPVDNETDEDEDNNESSKFYQMLTCFLEGIDNVEDAEPAGYPRSAVTDKTLPKFEI
ncbi:uncharacterized protein TNCV_2439321 [Trichonephila clavipes]|nr:uncharacterized protein TNCV_2439321 [Trichonephila clavipes]